MNKLFTKISLAALACLATGFAIAGIWNNSYPIVGGASFSCGSVNAVSNCTVAAGPASITGAETFPADTNLTQGRNPQTVQIPTLTMANYSRGTGLLYSTAVVTAGVAGTTTGAFDTG